ncbi:MAG: HAD family hydrolase [Hyphomicrobiaceae bacterium]|nr:HAD family hydrolase [Hyphomicrobiaceae bacterium]
MITTPSTRWLLVLDVDRTLLTDDYRLLPEVRRSIDFVRNNSIALALATARGPVALEVVLDALGPVDYAICFGGALTLGREAGGNWERSDEAEERLVDPAAGHALIELARSLDIPLARYGEATVYVDALNDQLIREFAHTGDRYRIADLLEVQEPAFKYLAIARPGRTGTLDQLAAQLTGHLSAVRSHANYLEIGPTGVSKGAALRALCRVADFDLANVAAIGDSENDLSMIAAAGHGVAMGNAIPAVKAAAAFCTATNADAGVSLAIERLAKDLWQVAPADKENEVEEVLHV